MVQPRSGSVVVTRVTAPELFSLLKVEKSLRHLFGRLNMNFFFNARICSPSSFYFSSSSSSSFPSCPPTVPFSFHHFILRLSLRFNFFLPCPLHSTPFSRLLLSFSLSFSLVFVWSHISIAISALLATQFIVISDVCRTIWLHPWNMKKIKVW